MRNLPSQNFIESAAMLTFAAAFCMLGHWLTSPDVAAFGLLCAGAGLHHWEGTGQPSPDGLVTAPGEPAIVKP